MGLSDVMNWASGTDLLPDTSANASSVGMRTLTELSQVGELGASSPAAAAKFVTPGGGRGPRAGEVTPHSSEYADLQRAIELAEIASKHTPKSAKSKQMQLQKLDGSSLAYTPAAPQAFGSPASATDELRERKAQMQTMLDAGIITPAEYTKMVGSLRAEAALTPAKQVHAPSVQNDSAASPIFTVEDTMTESELAALAAERAGAQANEQVEKVGPDFSGSPATALAAAIDSGPSSTAAFKHKERDEIAAALNAPIDTELTEELKSSTDASVPAPSAVVSDSAVTADESVRDDLIAEGDLPRTPVPATRAVQQSVGKSPASTKADGILARWHKWDLDYARDYMHQQMELDELRQLALEFG